VYGEGTGQNDAVQYPELYYAGSILPVEFTVQHGCGGNQATDPSVNNCHNVGQIACDMDVMMGGSDNPSNTVDMGLTVSLASGMNTGVPDTTGDADGDNDNTCNTDTNIAVADITATMDANDAAAVGRHESEASYCECQQRSRNLGLFIADQEPADTTSQHTRQNAGGDRSGLECAEERDYFPYWNPTIWRDIFYLTNDVSTCPMVQAESQNVAKKGKCQNANDGGLTKTTTNAITEAECTGTWSEYTFNMPAPTCALAPWQHMNHLGNARTDESTPQMAAYNMTLPDWDSLTSPGMPVRVYEGEYAKCVFRLRYNITTDDYDPWTTDYTSNGIDNSPVRNDDNNAAVGLSTTLNINIATDQFGRTFQDRTHVFFIRKKTEALDKPGVRIHNLGVRGKRGNIVQTYPAIEYDFSPNNLYAAPGDLIHMQWCGSNTHANGNPAGDGQNGSDGQGADNTDRSNILQMMSQNGAFPVPYNKMAEIGVPDLFGAGCMGAHSGTPLGAKACAVRAASSGYHLSEDELNGSNMNETLDNTPAAFRGAGILVNVDANCPAGQTHYIMGSRNNSFTNRGQKGKIICTQAQSA